MRLHGGVGEGAVGYHRAFSLRIEGDQFSACQELAGQASRDKQWLKDKKILFHQWPSL